MVQYIKHCILFMRKVLILAISSNTARKKSSFSHSCLVTITSNPFRNFVNIYWKLLSWKRIIMLIPCDMSSGLCLYIYIYIYSIYIVNPSVMYHVESSIILQFTVCIMYLWAKWILWSIKNNNLIAS